ncbi:unnamed protein product [Kuraishia capsulata CBS 1993]|uniref:U1 small nuclear ribonucleoprotein component SNU71 n=1 Tax=Kuraishia capsulata CBS 1993 TaxID=1382522 RepID=W6MLY2_9ASCO|nr:uncharacterized protein KUCA_T00003474001 [Kuraishia capsulata CBS 1993]CDK27496.1 unnamed protein product [Kuraishia capsulata CBS 1993]
MSYRGASVSQETMNSKLKKELSGMKFPKIFKEKVDLQNIDKMVIDEWIRKRLDELIPDDDILVEFTLELLHASNTPDMRTIQLQLLPFLGETDSPRFCKELWELLLSAQDDKDGIPAVLLEARKKEIERQRALEVAKKENRTRKDRREFPTNRDSNFSENRARDHRSSDYRSNERYDERDASDRDSHTRRINHRGGYRDREYNRDTGNRSAGYRRRDYRGTDAKDRDER